MTENVCKFYIKTELAATSLRVSVIPVSLSLALLRTLINFLKSSGSLYMYKFL
jgi:hypothetical protein